MFIYQVYISGYSIGMTFNYQEALSWISHSSKGSIQKRIHQPTFQTSEF